MRKMREDDEEYHEIKPFRINAFIKGPFFFISMLLLCLVVAPE
jgi:hypothetical protein